MAKSEKFRLPKIWERVQDNENNIGNLETINVKSRDVAFNKKQNKIVIFKNRLVVEKFTSNLLFVNLEFTALPEWAIPFMHVHTLFHTEEGFEVNKFLSFWTTYHWKQFGGNYILKYTLRGDLKNVLTEVPLSLSQAPLYIDLEIHVLNEFAWHQIQQSKD